MTTEHANAAKLIRNLEGEVTQDEVERLWNSAISEVEKEVKQ